MRLRWKRNHNRKKRLSAIITICGMDFKFSRGNGNLENIIEIQPTSFCDE